MNDRIRGKCGRRARFLLLFVSALGIAWVVSSFHAGMADRSVTHYNLPLAAGDHVLHEPGILASNLELNHLWTAKRMGGTFSAKRTWECFVSSLPPEEFESRLRTIINDFNTMNRGKLEYLIVDHDDDGKFLRDPEDWKMRWQMRGLLPPTGTRYITMRFRELPDDRSGRPDWWIHIPKGKSMIIYRHVSF